MMTIDQLITVPTVDQTVENITGQLVGLGVPADQWRKAGPLSVVRRVVATLYVAFAGTMVLIAKFGILTLSTGGWLDLLAFYVYGVLRTPATFATGAVTLTNPGGFLGNFDPQEAIFQNASTGATYANNDAFVLNPGTTITINVTATIVGLAGNANPGDVSKLVTQMSGVSVTNAAPIVGLDAQSDEDLVETCQQRLSARSVRGPRNAYKYYATHAADDTTLVNASGNPVNLNRVQVSPSSHTGVVTTYLAAPQGQPTDDDVAAARTNIEQNVRPEGVTSVVSAATPVSYGPTLVVWCQAEPGLQAANVQTVILTALSDFFEDYPVGGLSTDTQQGLFATRIDGVVESTNTSIFKVDGAVDLFMVDGQVAVSAMTSANVQVRIVG